MNDSRIAALGGVVLVLALVVGALALATGAVTLPGATDGDGSSETSTTATAGATTAAGPAPGGTTADDPDEATTTATTATTTVADEDAFGFAIEGVEECGSACRDVTVTLENRQEAAATGVSVTSRIWAGNTTSGDPIWTGTEAVGDLGPGETYTATERVDLSLSEAFAVDRADGWITVETTIDTDDRTITVTERRDVG